MLSEPFISNDLFIFYSDVVLIQKYDNPTTAHIYQNAIQQLSRQHIIVFIATELLEYYFPFIQSIMTPFILITTCNDDFVFHILVSLVIMKILFVVTIIF